MTWLHANWRAILSRLPLPMLALAASWGVYSFAAAYVPQPIAIIQAAAFELTYIGLAVTRDLSDAQRRRATGISLGAVVVSVLYNSIDGYFARNPAQLAGLPAWAEALGAVLHGAPLAIVAYLVADLLLHSGTPADTLHALLDAPPVPHASPVLASAAESGAETTAYESVPVVSAKTSKAYACPACGHALSLGQYGSATRYGHCPSCKEAR